MLTYTSWILIHQTVCCLNKQVDTKPSIRSSKKGRDTYGRYVQSPANLTPKMSFDADSQGAQFDVSNLLRDFLRDPFGSNWTKTLITSQDTGWSNRHPYNSQFSSLWITKVGFHAPNNNSNNPNSPLFSLLKLVLPGFSPTIHHGFTMMMSIPWLGCFNPNFSPNPKNTTWKIRKKNQTNNNGHKLRCYVVVIHH